MPKIGMEPLRRDALVKATIAEIGAAGSLDVTVSQIARRAGMSSALAHHYFGGKEDIFVAAMRRILTDFGAEVRSELARAPASERAAAIIRTCFARSCFTPQTISAWMTFYVMAQTNDQALRLWHIYQNRIRSNLCHALRPYSADPVAAANTLAALIDGLYIRSALNDPDAPQIATAHALSVLDMLKAPRQ
ncbi:choline-binding transcriptional repressor BetI [Sedimentitalea nanhaiensis]|uniref:HTH-type transcriptional regulator BetI n=1 Tax=Sedimentitalea nanhaiensis TaxID=999627 RepID=A0A1I6YAK0_9RHOB|nr:transcriptional regulator BetI [Sedimentitalea nanhaiensis]SFT47301.1 transcriptional regulator, TetR family [Sedimentitalea nanhaiensis]